MTNVAMVALASGLIIAFGAMGACIGIGIMVPSTSNLPLASLSS